MVLFSDREALFIFRLTELETCFQGKVEWKLKIHYFLSNCPMCSVVHRSFEQKGTCWTEQYGKYTQGQRAE